jgi:hypothetical protein
VTGGNADRHGGIGGGSTDFRLVAGDWNNHISLNSRIMVAGGGGGGGSDNNLGANKNADGGAGGGLTAGEGLVAGSTTDINATGGTQISGGTKASITNESGKPNDGKFGMGGSLIFHGGGGGGGYYGGGAGTIKTNRGIVSGGGGGSSFISGFTGCVAIDPTDTTNDPRTQDAGTGFAKTALNFNTAVFGTSPTWADGKEIAFTNTVMIDGKGFEWKDGIKASTAGTMPNPAGGTMTGNSGNGHARITLLYQY